MIIEMFELNFDFMSVSKRVKTISDYLKFITDKYIGIGSFTHFSEPETSLSDSPVSNTGVPVNDLKDYERRFKFHVSPVLGKVFPGLRGFNLLIYRCISVTKTINLIHAR